MVAHDGRTPPYLQLVSQLARALREGELRPGDRLPAAAALAARTGVDRNTALRAYRELAAVGLAVVEQGRGTFVGPVVGGNAGDERGQAVLALRLDRCVRSARRLGLDDESVVRALRVALRRAGGSSSRLVAQAAGASETRGPAGQPCRGAAG